MTDEQNSGKDKGRDQTPSPASVPLKSGGEIVVTYLDSPPPAGKTSIHPRRRAPIVPNREERTGERSTTDEDSKKPDSG
jgi:hypothetical protein